MAALIPILNPMGQMPIFLSQTQDIPAVDRKILAQKIATYGFFLLVASMFIGTYLLKFFGISLPVVQVGGGLLVSLTGWSLLQSPDTPAGTLTPNQQQAVDNEAIRAAYSRRAFFPLTFPLTVGPGSISVAITLGANLRTQATGEGIILVSSILGVVAVAATVYFCYRYADRLVSRLGEIGAVIVLRLSAFILLCLGIQIMWNGLSELLKSLHI